VLGAGAAAALGPRPRGGGEGVGAAAVLGGPTARAALASRPGRRGLAVLAAPVLGGSARAARQLGAQGSRVLVLEGARSLVWPMLYYLAAAMLRLLTPAAAIPGLPGGDAVPAAAVRRLQAAAAAGPRGVTHGVGAAPSGGGEAAALAPRPVPRQLGPRAAAVQGGLARRRLLFSHL
jgi:hypothetical protein